MAHTAGYAVPEDTHNHWVAMREYRAIPSAALDSQYCGVFRARSMIIYELIL